MAHATNQAPVHSTLLRYHFAPAETFHTELVLRTESRAHCGAGYGESESGSRCVIRTDVLQTNEASTLVRASMVESEGEGLNGDEQLLQISSRGVVTPMSDGTAIPGSWYPLPEGYASAGTTWRCSGVPFQSTSAVSIFYTVERLEMRNGREVAIISWNCPAVSTPNTNGRHEYRAWGTYVVDVVAGRLEEARTVTRIRDVGPGWESEAISQLDLRQI